MKKIIVLLVFLLSFIIVNASDSEPRVLHVNDISDVVGNKLCEFDDECINKSEGVPELINNLEDTNEAVLGDGKTESEVGIEDGKKNWKEITITIALVLLSIKVFVISIWSIFIKKEY